MSISQAAVLNFFIITWASCLTRRFLQQPSAILTVPVYPHSGNSGRKERILAWFPAGRRLARLSSCVCCFCSLAVHEAVGIALATPSEAGCCFGDVCLNADSPGSSLGFDRSWHQPPSFLGTELVGREREDLGLILALCLDLQSGHRPSVKGHGR